MVGMLGGTVLFDHGPDEGGGLFARPSAVIRASDADEVPQALAAMQAAQDAGYWLAGMASYELGYVVSPKLRPLLPPGRDVPLIEFGVFDRPRPEAGFLAGLRPDAVTLSAPVPRVARADYAAAFARLHSYIGAGDVYQANLTFPMDARCSGDPRALYLALRAAQPVPYGAYHDLGGPVILSRSPELFFSISDGVIETRPMKGTQPRGATPEQDAAAVAFLQADEKNRAENLMIVDLLRNDVSRLCRPGSVRVHDLFAVETYATVHQMTSLVRGALDGPVPLADLFAALFPCGSVTGAPKIRAMQIIRELEPDPRGAYCGALGWIAPTGDMRFNVAIRTLTLFGDRVRLNVGGGVVWDSTAASEYEEALWKARYATLPLMA